MTTLSDNNFHPHFQTIPPVASLIPKDCYEFSFKGPLSLCITMVKKTWRKGRREREDQRALAQDELYQSTNLPLSPPPDSLSVSSVLLPDHQGFSPQDAGAEPWSHCDGCQLSGLIQHSWSGG